MAERSTIAWIVLIIGLSSSIFFFLINEDDQAIDFLFLGIYATISVLFFLRILFYFKYKATLNELYFFGLSIIIPTLIFFIAPIIPMNSKNFLKIMLNTTEGIKIFPNSVQITFLSVLAFPYLLLSSILLIRSFTRYKFIRLTPHAERGLSAEVTAIFSFFVFGIILFLAGLQTGDLLSLTFGFFYVLSGFAFVLGK